MSNLRNVKAGDVLIRVSSCVYVSDRLVTVDRVTKTLVVADNKRYRRKDGYECGQHMWPNWLRIPTGTEIMQLQERDNRSIENIDRSSNHVSTGSELI